MTPIAIRNLADTMIDEDQPTKNFNNTNRLKLNGTTGQRMWALLYFNRPWPVGATILSAKLYLRTADVWAGSTTLYFERLFERWSINRVTWSNQPSIGGSTVAVTLPALDVNETFECDITGQVQAWSNGSPYFGFRIRTSRAADSQLHSVQSGVEEARPVLVVEWTDTPDEPDNLNPGGGLAASLEKPYLTWSSNDPNGDLTLSAVQVQIGTSEANVNAGISTWDSGTVVADAPELDLSATSYPGHAEGVTVWWRCRNQESSGEWSVWAEATSFVRIAKGTVTLDSPSTAIYEGSPLVEWTLTGGTQSAYQVFLSETDDGLVHIWDSGKISGDDDFIKIPFGEITDEGRSYRVGVKVWDDVDRAASPNDPASIDTYGDFSIAYDGAVSPVTMLDVASDLYLPIAHLSWERATAPDSWQIQVSEDMGNTFKYIHDVPVVGPGPSYTYDDTMVPTYKEIHWRVLAIEGGRQAAGSPIVTGQVRRLAPFLMRPDGSDAVCFLNPKRSRKRLDVQEVHDVLAGPPILVTQRLGGESGSVEGRFIDDVLPDVSAKEMKARFMRLRRDSGVIVHVLIADETVRAVAYNFQVDSLTDTSGITYLASFDWIQV